MQDGGEGDDVLERMRRMYKDEAEVYHGCHESDGQEDLLIEIPMTDERNRVVRQKDENRIARY